MKNQRENQTSQLSQGNKLFREGNIEKALEKYIESVNKNEYYFTLENIGYVYEKLQKFDQAKLYYERALQINNGAARASYFLKKYKPTRKICLTRIIGNELPDLHSEEQNYENLKFILENESDHVSIDKVFILNRIVSKIKKEKYKKLITQKGFKFLEIPFNSEDYQEIKLYYEDLPENIEELDEWSATLAEVSKRKLKNKYLMNNNGARNFAINHGVSNGYEWTLPLDGNCYFTKTQLNKIASDLSESSESEYVIIPMQRITENIKANENIVAANFTEEPQIGFKKTAKTLFSEEKVYGNQPKVELLKVLGVPGNWDGWVYEYPWKKIKIREKTTQRKYFISSSTYRLSSGNSEAAKNSKSRANIRANAIIKHIDNIDRFLKLQKSNNSITDFYYYQKTTVNSKPEDSTGILNQYFDKIYLVNLKHQTKERLTAENHLKNNNITFETYTAINGYQKKYKDWFNSYSKRPIGELTYFKEHEHIEKGRKKKLIESPGAVGYIQTYIKILQNAKYNKHKRILILEDDVILCENFNERFKEFIKNIKKDWKILLLGASQYGWKSVDQFYSLRNGFYYPRIHDTKGSFAIAFDESIYNELINNQSHMDAPFDHIPLGDLYEKHLGKCFTAFPYLVMPDVSSSTIRGRVQDEHSNRMKWWLGDFIYPQKKPNVGIFISDPKSIKNINWIWDKNLPFTLSLLKSECNGIVPIHNAEQTASKDSKKISANELSKLGLNYDFFYLWDNEKPLTQDLIMDKLTGKPVEGSKVLTTTKPVNYNFKPYIDNRVTVILPTYKRPENLRAAAKSVLEQCYNDIELIIVDDNGASSKYHQETRNLVNDLRKEYLHRNIIYIQHEVNANGASARNTGIFASSGEYICFLDDDDIYLEGRIAKSVEAIQHTNNNIGAVYCGFLGWNSSKIDLSRFAEGNLSKNLLALDYKSHYLHTNTVTYKRSAIFNINGFDPTFKRHQDLEFNLRFFEEYEVRAVRECLVRLAPSKSTVDNKLYDMNFLKMKTKFLRKFAINISHFNETDKNAIYQAHWDELMKYAGKYINSKNLTIETLKL